MHQALLSGVAGCGQEQRAPVAPDDFGALPAGQAQQVIVAIADTAFAIEHQREQLDIGQHVAVTPLAFAQLVRHARTRRAFVL